MKSLLYFLILAMFLGLGLMIWSSYKAITVAQQNDIIPAHAPGGPIPAVSNPEVSRYVSLSYFGLTLFIVGAVGGIFAVVKVMVRRF